MRNSLFIALLVMLALPLFGGRGFSGSDVITAPGIGTPLDISTGPMTISVWFNASTVDGSEHDVAAHWDGGGHRQWLIGIGLGCSTCGTKNLSWVVGSAAPIFGIFGSCPTNITPGVWYNATLGVDTAGKYGGSPVAGMTVTAPSLGLYGQNCQAQAFAERRVAGIDNLTIGVQTGAGTYFKGSIAEFGIWNDILSPSERAALASGVSPNRIRRSSLVGYFPLYGAYSPEPDLSGNKDNGTLTGTTVVSHCPCGSAVYP